MLAVLVAVETTDVLFAVADVVHLPVWASLAVIAGVLGIEVAASLGATRAEAVSRS